MYTIINMGYTVAKLNMYIQNNDQFLMIHRCWSTDDLSMLITRWSIDVDHKMIHRCWSKDDPWWSNVTRTNKNILVQGTHECSEMSWTKQTIPVGILLVLEFIWESKCLSMSVFFCLNLWHHQQATNAEYESKLDQVPTIHIHRLF